MPGLSEGPPSVLAVNSTAHPPVRRVARPVRALPPPVRGLARPVRPSPPRVRIEPVVLAAPPPVPEPEGTRWMTALLPALSSLGIVGFAFLSRSVVSIAVGTGLALLSVVAAIVARRASVRARRHRHE